MGHRWGARIGMAWCAAGIALGGCVQVPEIEDGGIDASVDAPDAAIDVEPDVPVIGGPFALEVGSLELSVRRGEAVTVPVLVRRIPGFDARVTISADGLPEGTSARAVRDDDEGRATALSIEASDDAETVQRAAFVISASGAGHRRTWRASIDVLPR